MDAGFPKSMITIAVLASAIIFGILLAKVVDAFHDRQSIRDDVSDISDYTRDLLKEQLSVAFTKGQKQELQPEDLAKTYFKMWATKTKKDPVTDEATIENGADTQHNSESGSATVTATPNVSNLATTVQLMPQTNPTMQIPPLQNTLPTREDTALAPIEITEDKKLAPSKSTLKGKKK